MAADFPGHSQYSALASETVGSDLLPAIQRVVKRAMRAENGFLAVTRTVRNLAAQVESTTASMSPTRMAQQADVVAYRLCELTRARMDEARATPDGLRATQRAYAIQTQV